MVKAWRCLNMAGIAAGAEVLVDQGALAMSADGV
jgi:hypothetical protein